MWLALFIVINMEFQTREHGGIIKVFDDPKKAFDYAKDNSLVWKVSFGIGVNRVRLVRDTVSDDNNLWSYKPMQDAIDSLFLRENSPQAD